MTTTTAPNPSDVAHAAVHARMKGATPTPATITADLIEQGCTPAQAATVCRMACALIPTVTSRSLRTWLNAQAAA